MYPSHLSNYIIKESQSAVEAFWKLEKQRLFLDNSILVVLSEQDKYIGIITPGALRRKIMHLDDPMILTAAEACNKNGRVCASSPNSRIEAMAVFADNMLIFAVPVIDDAGNLIDIIFHEQVFYLEYYNGMVHYAGANKHILPRMHYAHQIYNAAQLAKNLGYESFSVIEFGVAGGNGLVTCEFHIKEIARLFNLKIELYGFDTGEGLPGTNDARDPHYLWDTGFFQMDIQKLTKRLQFAQLVIGDLNQTAYEFMQREDFAPIGVMLVDVDYYSATVPILNMLCGSTHKFLPRVHMYFDDVATYLEYCGEKLAIDELNAKSQDIKISKYINPPPEIPRGDFLYCAHLFRHEKYNKNAGIDWNLDLT